jgi:hypothetical protein
MDKKICVVHLVRACNGIKPLIRFIESYRHNPGGTEHDLLFVFKGSIHPQDIDTYRELLSPFKHSIFEISDRGFDITAYFAVAKRFSGEYHYFCFLNSFSELQDREWLLKLYKNASKPGVGLVGATGSWNSNQANSIIWFRNVFSTTLSRWLKNNQVNPGNRLQKEKKRSLRSSLKVKVKYYYKKSITLVGNSFNNLVQIFNFGPFPNYHIRTNAFMISGELMKSLKCPPLKTKIDAYRFESGKRGFTMQIHKKGKRVFVVGKDGAGYEKEEWHKSITFWSLKQENLLVSDNQTRDYQDGTPERCRYLSSIAWGVDYSEKQ